MKQPTLINMDEAVCSECLESCVPVKNEDEFNGRQETEHYDAKTWTSLCCDAPVITAQGEHWEPSYVAVIS